MTEPKFDVQAYMKLMPAIYRYDEEGKDLLARWMCERLTTSKLNGVFIIALAESCRLVMASMSSGLGTEGSFAALRLKDTASTAEVFMGRILTASLNQDSETRVALVNALLSHAVESGDASDVMRVQVLLIEVLSFVMQQASAGPEGV